MSYSMMLDFERLLAELSASGLVDAATIEPIAFRAVRGEEGDSSAAAIIFASELVQSGNLTAYQAREFLQGRGRNLIFRESEILEPLGSGGMGTVFKIRHRQLGRVQALKILSVDHLENTERRSRFQRECQAAAKLSHPNVATVFDSGTHEGIPFVVIEYIEGCDLAELVQGQGALSVEQSSACLMQAAGGLQAIHELGIIHRDVKPQNLLLDCMGMIKVVDFGLARTADQRDVTATDQLMGTLGYISPEQFLNSRVADARSDIYSLGCTLFYLLTGRPAFEGNSLIERLAARQPVAVPSLQEARPGIAEGFNVLFQQMLSENPDHRPQTMNEVMLALKPYGSAESLQGLVPPRSSAPLDLGLYLSQPALPMDIFPMPSVAKTNRASVVASSRHRHRWRWSLSFFVAGSLLGLGTFVALSAGWRGETPRRMADPSVTEYSNAVNRVREAAVQGDESFDNSLATTVRITNGPGGNVSIHGLHAEYFAGNSLTEKRFERVDPRVDWLWANYPPDARLKRDSFSVRWTGWLKPPAAGDYRFVLVADDGARLWIDERLVVDTWNSLDREEFELALEARPHSLRLEFENSRDSSLISFRWLPTDGHEQPVPSAWFFVDKEIATRSPMPIYNPIAPAANSGLRAELFSDWRSTEPAQQRVDSSIDFLWGRSRPSTAVAEDNFSVCWKGWLIPPVAGRYEIVAIVDDNVRVWLDDALIIEEQEFGWPDRFSQWIELAPRPYRLHVDYWEHEHTAVMSLRWRVPNSAEEVAIPASAFTLDNPIGAPAVAE